MVIKESVQELLNENMDRKKFLAFSGTIVLGALGITGLMKIILKPRLTQQSLQNNKQYPVQSDGYGGSNYGGN